jgi:pimeloyl-ACP methyl ester carboxylesterase
MSFTESRDNSQKSPFIETEVALSWKKPLVAICGDSGTLESRERTAALAGSLPNAKLHIMRGCGHYMNLENPVEFNAVITNLVRSVEDL